MSFTDFLKLFKRRIAIALQLGAAVSTEAELQGQAIDEMSQVFKQATHFADELRKVKEEGDPVKTMIAVNFERNLSSLNDTQAQIAACLHGAEHHGLDYVEPAQQPTPPPVAPPRIAPPAKPQKQNRAASKTSTPPPPPRKKRGRPRKNPPQGS